MNNALQITFTGGGMVFIGLMLLWIMMSILVKLTAEKKTPAPNHEEIAESENLELTQKKIAAAAAVTAALALLKSTISYENRWKDKGISSWQNTHRSRQLNQTISIGRRRGS